MERSEKEGGRKEELACGGTKAAVPGIRMAHSEGGAAECRSLELLAESESERSHYNVTPTSALRCPSAVCRHRRRRKLIRLLMAC